MNRAYEIEPSREGLPTLAVRDESGKKVYLHSRFHPGREDESMRDEFHPARYDLLVVLGTGLGYHLLPLRELGREYGRIILIDSAAGIECEIERNPLTGFLVRLPGITLLTGKTPREIEERLSLDIDLGDIRGLNVIAHPASLRAFPAYYGEINKSIERLIAKKAGDRATRKAFGKLYLRNIVKNLAAIPRLFPVSSFLGAGRGLPALVISSAPSMERSIESIGKNREALLLIAVDSALPVLRRHGITPDFFVSIDPQPWVGEHIIGTGKGPLPVLSISSTPLLFSREPGILSLNSHPAAQILEHFFPGAIGSIDSLTGTVAGDAIKLAQLLACRVVGLVGFDFSFSDYRIYARGTSYQDRFSLYFHDRFSPVETFNLNYIMKSSRGLRSGSTFTRRSFLQYREALEAYISRSGMENVFHINDRGLPLQSAIQTGMKSFVENFCSLTTGMKEPLRDTLSSRHRIGTKISLNAIREIFQNPDILDEMLNASLEGSITPENKEKIKSVINHIL